MAEPVVDLGNGRIRELKGMPLIMGILYDPLLETGHIMEASNGKQSVVPYYWNPGTLAFEIATTAGASVGTEVKVTNFPGSFPVTGTFWQATQPVSGSISVSNMVAQGVTDAQLRATPVPVSGSFYQATQPVSIAASVAVTGAFYQATQPVSIAAMPSTPVTGTFWQATQPISGSVTVTQATGTNLHAVIDSGVITSITNAVAVTGAFYQATQPVSIAAMPSTPVTGTFWQATQPVSGTFYQATQPVSIASMPSTPVTGTFWQATQPVSIAAAPVLVAGSAIIGKVGIDQTTPGTTNKVTLGADVVHTIVDSGSATANQGTAGSADWRIDMRRGQTLLFAVVNASANGDNTLVAADATKKIKVLQYTLVSAGTVNATFKSGAGTSLSGALPLVVNSGVASPFVAPAMGHIMETAVNQALVLNLSGAIAVTGHLTYILEA